MTLSSPERAERVRTRAANESIGRIGSGNGVVTHQEERALVGGVDGLLTTAPTMGAVCVAHLGHTAQYLYPNNRDLARSLGSLITVCRHKRHPSVKTFFAVVGATCLTCGISEGSPPIL